jgi:hypothetical protein
MRGAAWHREYRHLVVECEEVAASEPLGQLPWFQLHDDADVWCTQYPVIVNWIQDVIFIEQKNDALIGR